MESVLWTNSSIRYTFDGKARYRFDTDYGPFEYTLDLISGEISAAVLYSSQVTATRGWRQKRLVCRSMNFHIRTDMLWRGFIRAARLICSKSLFYRFTFRAVQRKF